MSKIKIDLSDPETRATYEAAERARDEVASWPAWKRGELEHAPAQDRPSQVTARRYVTGCAAAHPDQRGGQHVAMECPGVLAIDDDKGVGVLIASARSRMSNKAEADTWLSLILGGPDVAIVKAARAWRSTRCSYLPFCDRGEHENDCAIMVAERELVAAIDGVK